MEATVFLSSARMSHAGPRTDWQGDRDIEPRDDLSLRSLRRETQIEWPLVEICGGPEAPKMSRALAGVCSEMSEFQGSICECEAMKRWKGFINQANAVLEELDRQGIISSEWTRRHGHEERVWMAKKFR